MALPLVGCGQKEASPVAPERGDRCGLSTEAAEPLDTFTVILPDSVDLSKEPIPSNESEQLLFPQHFETLVHLDCAGQLRPGLAKTWTADETGRVWTFVLPDGQFADRSPGTASRVASTWRARDPGDLRDLGIESVAVRDSSSLVVTLNQLAGSSPRLFADASLAVPRARPSLASRGDLLVAQSGGSPPALIRFRLEPDSDPRDALDRGGDLVVTRDPALLDYLAARPEFTIFPLPWNRTYVLVQPTDTPPLELAGAEAERRSLARDAVSADARAAEPPFWWTGAAECPAGVAPRSTPAAPRIGYVRGDEVARGLAERMVALAGAGAGLRAAALEAAEFRTLLRNGADRAYVLPLPSQTLAPCRELAALPDGARVQPLIETRAHVVVRKGAPPLMVDWDGTVRVVPR